MAILHHLINPETGNTYREDNLAIQHSIPLGTLVEISGDYLDEDGEPDHDVGLRLYVVLHQRDCDGTPLYGLSFQHDWVLDESDPYVWVTKHRVLFGFNADSLTVIREPHQKQS